MGLGRNAAFLVIGLLLANAASAYTSRYDQRQRERIAQVQAHAGAAVDSVRYRGTYSFESLGQDSLLLWETPGRAYLVRVEPFCSDLPWVSSIGLSNQMWRLYTRFDKVYVRDQQCRITEIRPVDVKALKTDEREARAGKKNAA